MNKLRIGVIVYPENHPTEGGGYSYFNTLLKGINDFTFSPEIEIVNIVFYQDQAPRLQLKKAALFVKAGLADRIKRYMKNRQKKPSLTFTNRNPIISFLYKLFIRRRNKKVEQLLKQHQIDFVYYLKQQDHTLNYPFIATVWDVSHKSTNGFPEHSLYQNYEIREEYYLYTLNKAFLIMCESEAGAAELKQYYSFYQDKIKVLPLFGSHLINHQVPTTADSEILKQFNLQKDKYYLYPAQFWPHKNHYNLILAFYQLTRENNHQDLKLVLCGSDKGNYAYILQLIKSLNLSQQVIVPGFVTDDTLLIFYRNALALTMPTFLGPTNIPVIEAAHLNCPVLCSDLSGHREIMGNHALYFNPARAEAIQDAMQQVLNPGTRATLAAGARQHIQESPFNLENSLHMLNQTLLDILPVRKTWGVDYFLSLLLLLTLCNATA